MWLSIAILILIVVLLGIAFIVVTYKNREEKPQLRDVYMAYYEDGLLDVFLGLVIVTGGLLILTDQSAFIGVTFALLYPFLLAAKKGITAPRISAMALTAAQVSRRMQTMFLALGILLLLGALVFFLVTASVLPDGIASWLDRYLFDAILLLGVGLLTFWGMKTSAKRLYTYAGLLLVARIVSLWVAIAFPYYLIVIGFAIFIIGLVVLGQFTHEHPKSGGMSHA